MADNSSVELVRSAYDAFIKGDMETVSNAFADDIKWHIPGRNALAGDRASKAEVFEFFQLLGQHSGGTFNLEVLDVVGNEDHVVALTRERAEANGKSLDVRGCHVWDIRDGKAVEFWGISFDAYAEDEFWS